MLSLSKHVVGSDHPRVYRLSTVCLSKVYRLSTGRLPFVHAASPAVCPEIIRHWRRWPIGKGLQMDAPTTPEVTQFPHRVFEATSLPFCVDRRPLERPVLALEPAWSTADVPLESLPLSPRERFPTECLRSGAGRISIRSSGEAVPSALDCVPSELEITLEMIEAGKTILASPWADWPNDRPWRRARHRLRRLLRSCRNGIKSVQVPL